jgi:UDP-2,3-diacylglucosamine pyrophosphatase LpxH
MINIDYMSDLHMEINGNVAEQIMIPKGTSDDVLILDGDITCYRYFDPNRTDSESRGMRKRFAKFIHEKCGHYKKIIYIPGNHEYYGFYMDGADEWFQRQIEMIDSRLEVFNNKSYVNEKFTIIGSTFWVGFHDGLADPWMELIKRSVENGMNDFRLIRPELDSKSPITADHVQEIHRKSFDFIKTCAELHDTDTPLIVATHHAPCMMSHSNARFGDNDLKYGYITEYGDWICDSKIDHWIHGHTHHNVEYDIADCKVQSAMYGYLGHDRSLASQTMHAGRIEIGD